MTPPFVSVIVTTYNRKDLLKDTIESISGQTFTDFELIVVDNYSKYDVKAFVGSFCDPRIRLFFNNNHGVIAANRNYGIAKARGRYIAFCDDDDLWYPHKLEKQLIHFDNKDTIGVGSSVTYFGDLAFHKQRKVKEDLFLDFKDLLTDQTAALSSLIIVNQGFMFDVKRKYMTVEDFEFQLKLTSETGKKIRILAEPLICYRIHPQNEGKDITIAENVFNVLERYKDLLSNDNIQKLHYKYYFNLGIKALRCDSKSAEKYFASATRYASGEQRYIPFMVEKILRLPTFLINNLLLLYYKLSNHLAG